MKKDDKQQNEEFDELKNKYLRSLADYQNLEKQTQAWKEEFVKYASQSLVLQILEVLDDLEKAQAHLNDDGVKLIIDKLRAILKNDGLEEIEILGKDFDPNLAEVLEVVPGEEDNKIIEVANRGYQLNGKIVRVAKVKVSKK